MPCEREARDAATCAAMLAGIHVRMHEAYQGLKGWRKAGNTDREHDAAVSTYKQDLKCEARV